MERVIIVLTLYVHTQDRINEDNTFCIYVTTVTVCIMCSPAKEKKPLIG